jgi:monoamine oxidase
VESSRKERHGETKKQMEEIHSERSWSELRYLAVDWKKKEMLEGDLCS